MQNLTPERQSPPRLNLTPASPWRADRAGRFWLECGPALLRRPRLQSPLGALRGEPVTRYEWGDSDEEPALTIEVLLEADPATVLVCLTLDVPGRGALDQAGVTVTLFEDNDARQATTDASGTVRFPGVPFASLGTLRFQVSVDRTA